MTSLEIMAESSVSQEERSQQEVRRVVGYDALVDAVAANMTLNAEGLDSNKSPIEDWVRAVSYAPGAPIEATLQTKFGGPIAIDLGRIDSLSLTNDSPIEDKLLAIVRADAALTLVTKETGRGQHTQLTLRRAAQWIQDGETVNLFDAESPVPGFERSQSVFDRYRGKIVSGLGVASILLAACMGAKKDFGQPGQPVVVEGPSGGDTDVLSGTPTPEGVEPASRYVGVMAETDAASKKAFRAEAKIDPQIPDENIARYWVSGGGGSFEFGSVLGVTTQTETGTSTEERLLMKVNGEWVDLQKTEEEDMVVWRYLDPDTATPAQGVLGNLEAVLWYPRYTQEQWNAMSMSERADFYIAVAPPAKMAGVYEEFDPSQPEKRPMIIMDFVQIQDMLQEANVGSRLARTLFGGGASGEGSSGGDGGGDGAPTPGGTVEPTDEPTPAETEEANPAVAEGAPIPEGYGSPVLASLFGEKTFFMVTNNGSPLGELSSNPGDRVLLDTPEGKILLSEAMAMMANYTDAAKYRQDRDAGALQPITLPVFWGKEGPVTMDPNKVVISLGAMPNIPDVVYGPNNDQVVKQTDGWILLPYMVDGVNKIAAVRCSVGVNGEQVIEIGYNGTESGAMPEVALLTFITRGMLWFGQAVQNGGHIPSDITLVDSVADDEIDNGLSVDLGTIAKKYRNPDTHQLDPRTNWDIQVAK